MKKTAIVGVMLGLLGALGACSDSGSGTTEGGGGSGASGNATGTGGASPGACQSNPLICDDGQTCWPTDAEASAFECLASGSGKAGDECMAVVSQPACGDDMFCLRLQGDDTATCSPYCGGGVACPAGWECGKVQMPSMVVLDICLRPEEGTGGGGGGTGGSGGSGGSGGGTGGSGG